MKAITTITKKSIRELGIMAPIFFIAVFLGVIIKQVIPAEAVSMLVEQHIFIAIPSAALLGMILPIPRYATYPIAYALFLQGVGYGVVFAFIAGEVIIESVAGDFLEIKYFGTKFFISRIIVSTVAVTIGAFAIEAIL